MIPIALTIAGSDSSGGAGIQADLKTFSALGVYGASVITALTAQNTRGVTGIHPVPADFIRAQMDAVFADLDVRAVKIGMLGTAEAVKAVADGLKAGTAAPVVLDPVMIAASGDPLLDRGAEKAIVDHLFPLAAIVTPNLAEAARLLGETEAKDEDSMRRQAERLAGKGARAVLVKGGHGGGGEAVDILHDGQGFHRFAAPRIDTRNVHGTGCTLASAIAAGLAKGMTLAEAAGAAKTYLTGALEASNMLDVGAGSGPVHHFFDLWKDRG
ncbi:MAG: bifunctional hydroxymethylpyrimidine kinase/phosphomethylpyrimidine kinase [Pseudomonadota bacterium]|nr:bifunctional hydroxymethylpyrimidine kinase/phosphomethylpyrimidine kinase [Pseudomonadota bacterium]